MVTIHSRIAQLINEKCEGNKSAFARRLNVTPAYAAQLYSGAREPSDRTVSDICREFGCDEVWLYVGAELPLGWDSYTRATVNDTYSNTRTKRAFVLGLGAFVGLQAYIADLPLAVGVEYGISSRLDAGLKYKNVTVSDNTTTTTYTSNYNDLPNVAGYNSDSYSKLAARKGEIGGQIRVTLSYYFK